MTFIATAQYDAQSNAQFNAQVGQQFQQEKRRLELERLKAENRNIVNSTGSTSKTGLSTGDIGGLQERLANLGLTQQEKLMGLSNKYRTLEGGTQGQVDEQAFRRQAAEGETKKYMQEKDIGGMNLRQSTEIGSREKMQSRGFDNVEVQRSRDAARAQGALRSVRSSGL